MSNINIDVKELVKLYPMPDDILETKENIK